MGLAILAFIVMAGTILGGYAAVMVLPGRIAERRLDRRLRDLSAAPIVPEGDEAEKAIVKPLARGPMPVVDRLLADSWMSRLIEQAGVQTAPSAILVLSVIAAASLWLIASIFARQPLVAQVAALAGLLAPTLVLMRKRSMRLKRFEEQFPEALDLLSRAIRAGHAFQTAMGMVADELHPPVGPEFRKSFDQQNFGLPLREALNEMAERINLLDVRFFVTAVLIQRETGGNLAEILDNLAQVVRERFKIRRQVRVHTAHGRFTGYVLLGLPAALGVALMFINPELMRLLFQERMGRIMLSGAMVLQTVGYFWIRHVIKIEV
jgi:tight adherence protein B